MALELVKLDSGTLPAIANAIREKTGDTALLLPSQMPNAIAGIPSGIELPALTTPAEDSDVLNGKEYIGAAGEKRTGTLVVCDTVGEVGTVSNPGVGLEVEIESIADASVAVLTLPEPNLKPENIKSGISIFGIHGSLVGGGAKEPYIEETYDANGNLIDVNLVGYTAIRPYAFYNCTKLALTSLPNSITSIGNGAFQYCNSLTLTSLPSGLTRINDYAFNNCTKLALTSLPNSITSIGNGAFDNCTNLALTSLPSGLTSIGSYAFRKCTNLTLASLPSGLTSIGTNAFRDCTGLTSITFNGKPGSIDSAAFNGCTNLKTINVPWTSGEVANAPWGATNATINYNYTG